MSHKTLPIIDILYTQTGAHTSAKIHFCIIRFCPILVCHTGMLVLDKSAKNVLLQIVSGLEKIVSLTGLILFLFNIVSSKYEHESEAQHSAKHSLENSFSKRNIVAVF